MKNWLMSIAVLICLVITQVGMGREGAKKVVDQDAYQHWNRIDSSVLSNDGSWVAYTVTNAMGEGELVVRSTRGPKEFRAKRGAIPRKAMEFGVTGYFTDSPAEFSADSGFVIYTIIGETHVIEDSQARSRNQEFPDPTVTLAFMRLSDGRVTELGRVSSFSVPKKGPADRSWWLRWGRVSSFSVPKKGNSHVIAYRLMGEIHRAVGTLVVRDLRSTREVRIDDVREFALASDGRHLAYVIRSTHRERDGVYVLRLSDERVASLLTGPGDYGGLVFDNDGSQLAFIARLDEQAESSSRYSLYYSESPLAPARVAVSAAELNESEFLQETSKVRFTRTGNAIVFNIVHAKPDSRNNRVEDGQARFEFWHWRMPTPIPQGNISSRSAGRIQKKGYLAVYHIAQQRWVRLENQVTPTVLLPENARYAIGLAAYQEPVSQTPDGREHLWSPSSFTFDVYLIDALTGQRRLFRRGMQPNQQQPRITCESTPIFECNFFSLSPGGRYALYFENRRWWSLELATGKVVDLTGSLLPGVRFHVDVGRPVSMSHNIEIAVESVGGWTLGDRRVLLYGDHDVWLIDPTGASPPQNLTDGVGARENIVFRRLEDFDFAYSRHAGIRSLPRKPFIEDSESLLLMGVDQDTMESGIWRKRLNAVGPPEVLLRVDKQITPIAQAVNSQQYLVSMESFREYPDLWTGPSFDQLIKISDVNPQQSLYRWGAARLVEFTSDYGVPLKGILYTPDGFDPKRKYPLVVSIYQISRWMLHRYAIPEPLRSSSGSGDTAWPSLVSRGYVHFVPDIQTVAPYSAPSALAAVVPAVYSLIDRGFIDSSRIALTGHSFGSYEVNYIVTQTDLFRCAVSDAGPTDTRSFHATGRLGTRYVERGQLVHGGSPSDRPFVYIANSAVFYANRVRTPLLLMYNDGDTNPPISQGIEFFSELRRNGKEVYMFNYHGEGHGLRNYENRLDWEKRVYAFLDYYLKDGPRPEWMDVGG